MVDSPVLSAPVQRTLPGAAVAGGSVQASYGWGPFGPSEGADQAVIGVATTGYYPWPSEGADQAFNSYDWYPSEGADQAFNGYDWHPSEGADQSYHSGWSFQPSEG